MGGGPALESAPLIAALTRYPAPSLRFRCVGPVCLQLRYPSASRWIIAGAKQS